MGHMTAEHRAEEAGVDSVIEVAEALARLEAAFAELRTILARHHGGARYISPGTAAAAAVRAAQRRSARGERRSA